GKRHGQGVAAREKCERRFDPPEGGNHSALRGQCLRFGNVTFERRSLVGRQSSVPRLDTRELIVVLWMMWGHRLQVELGTLREVRRLVEHQSTVFHTCPERHGDVHEVYAKRV